MKITKNISVHETLFTQLRKNWMWQVELLPICSIDCTRILIGWLNFTVDIHREEEDDVES